MLQMPPTQRPTKHISWFPSRLGALLYISQANVTCKRLCSPPPALEAIVTPHCGRRDKVATFSCWELFRSRGNERFSEMRQETLERRRAMSGQYIYRSEANYCLRHHFVHLCWIEPNPLVRWQFVGRGLSFLTHASGANKEPRTRAVQPLSKPFNQRRQSSAALSEALSQFLVQNVYTMDSLYLMLPLSTLFLFKGRGKDDKFSSKMMGRG